MSLKTVLTTLVLGALCMPTAVRAADDLVVVFPLTAKKLCDAGLGSYSALRYATSAPTFKTQFNWSGSDYYLNKRRNTNPVIEFSENPFVVEQPTPLDKSNRNIFLWLPLPV